MTLGEPTANLPRLSRAAFSESSILHAADLLQDGAALAAGQRLHNAHAHTAGVVAGFQSLTLTKLEDQPLFGSISMSPGAAVDQEGNLLLWDGSQRASVSWPSAEIGELHVWIYDSSDKTADHEVGSAGEHEWGDRMTRSAASVEFRLQVAKDQTAAYAGHVYLGAYSITSENGSLLCHYERGRVYVAAKGDAIEGCSGDTRLLLGAEQPRDMRRFAVTCKSGAAYQNVMTWETNHTLNLHAPVSVQRESIERTDFRVQEHLRFVGFAKAAETTAQPWSIQRVESEKNGRTFQELRIAIAKPDDETLQLRSRCSLGRAELPENEVRKVVQAGESLGVLSILGDGSVEVVQNLWVFADREHGRPGLILNSKTHNEAAAVNTPEIVTDALSVFTSATWSPDQKKILMVVRVGANQSIHSLRLLATIVDAKQNNMMPRSHDFPLTNIPSAGVVVPLDPEFDLPPGFSTDIQIEILVLGITENSQLAQFRGQLIPSLPTA